MGSEPLFFRDGATIPALAIFQQHLGVETLGCAAAATRGGSPPVLVVPQWPGDRYLGALFPRASHCWCARVAGLALSWRPTLSMRQMSMSSSPCTMLRVLHLSS
jgi:hypothetical protein